MSFDISIDVEGIDSTFASVLQDTKETRNKFVRELWKELVSNTPVDTGTARASWDIAKSFAALKDIEYGRYGYPRLPSIPDSTMIVVGSKLDYMIYLNEGWSAQAPALFVERSVAIAYNRVK
jgi:hypothetical protein